MGNAAAGVCWIYNILVVDYAAATAGRQWAGVVE